jgi:alkanesulfonate monooxygenase SsuD/methylene tetrahydromethanopterin reductase-like flavin-dependent oxidoreductase (luciferase family)
MTLSVAVVVSDAHPRGVDATSAWAQDTAFVRSVRDHGLDAVTLRHGWATAAWNVQAVAAAAHLSAVGDSLRMAIRGIPLGVVNPIEVAEQLATVDHAWAGRLDAGIAQTNAVGAPAHGLDRAAAAARFDEALALVRAMWSRDRLAGVGPHFRFDEVRPTLLPFQAHGPPLSLSAGDGAAAASAAGKGLGLHVEPWVPAADVEPLIRTYRDAGGDGPVSVERGLAYGDHAAVLAGIRSALDAASGDERVPVTGDVLLPGESRACLDLLARWLAAGLGQLEVRLRSPAAAPGNDLAVLTWLADSVVTPLRG